MNIGNVMNTILTEGKNQNIALGKLGIQAKPTNQINQINQMALNLNQVSSVEGEMSLGQSLFKQLLLSNPNLKAALAKSNQANQINLGGTGKIIDELPVDEETETATDGKDNCQVMSSMDIKMILNNANLNKIDLKLKEAANLEIVETMQNEVVNSTKVEKMQNEVQPQINRLVASTENGLPEENTAGTEMKPSNQGMQTDLKEQRLKGIENASLNNHKEINMEKQEKLTALRSIHEEKPVGIENVETIFSINKPGNIVIDQIEVNPKNQKLENLPVYNQIAEEIAAKLEQKGPTEFKLQLKPENLGEIDISIKISDGKLSIDIISANAKTQDLLVSQVDKLIGKLGLQNFQIENVQINPGTTTSATPSTTNNEAENQAAMLNLGMNFSDRRQQENLKEQNFLKKELKGISSLSLDGKELINSIEVSRGIDFSKHKINYAI